MRWVVGDLQGCARELEDLLRAIHFDASRDELWCVGDMINRGPESLATLRLWRDIGGRGVIGNHEVYALLSRAGVWPRKTDTLATLDAAPDAEALYASVRALPLLVHLPGDDDKVPGAWLVHAGVDPRWTDLFAVAQQVESRPHDDAWLQSEPVSFGTRVRCCDVHGQRHKWDREALGCPPGFLPWDEYYRGPTLVVHGHWAWRGAYRTAHTMGLDSACVYGGRLTAWCQQEDRLVDVPSRQPKTR
jgi:bis(5'-nucleosyl)-tetraphosphatase (symmetrical)